ncbi:nuclease-related domain-containing protein [Nocardia sp. NPDC059240]|uniref:nuclease-related domain-containing protein n=1 Tax=Nocardia sp. NPDC059240 TaxID=3346786 RepID=UPI0036CEDB77
MLILNGDRPKMSGAERTVLGWLQSSTIPGLAISGCHVPDRDGRHSQEADLVIFTPETLLCIEVKGILQRYSSGILSCAVNNRWQLAGTIGDPIHVRSGDTNPLEQLAGVTYGLKHLAAQTTGQEIFVQGLVLIMSNAGTITLDKGPIPMPTGRDVLLGDTSSDLTNWLTGTTRRRPQIWTAERILGVLAALGLADAVTHADLIEAGFPASPAPETNDEAIVVDLFPTPTAEPPRPAAPLPRPTRRSTQQDLGRSQTQSRSEAGIPVFYDPARETGRRPAPIRSAVLAGAALCLFTGGAWILGNTAAHGHSPRSTVVTQSTTQTPGEPVVPAPVVPTATAAPLFTVPAQTAKPCYPFQPGC